MQNLFAIFLYPKTQARHTLSVHTFISSSHGDALINWEINSLSSWLKQ